MVNNYNYGEVTHAAELSKREEKNLHITPLALESHSKHNILAAVKNITNVKLLALALFYVDLITTFLILAEGSVSNEASNPKIKDLASQQ